MGKQLQSVGFLLGVAHRHVSARFQQHLQPYDITPEQWSILYQVTQQEGMIQKSIAEQTFKDKPTITRILHQLQQKGYVTRIMDKQDRRSFRIYSTEQGRHLIIETERYELEVCEEIQNAIGEVRYKELLSALLQIKQKTK